LLAWCLGPHGGGRVAYFAMVRYLYPRGLSDGEGACASVGAAAAVGLPILRGGAGGVWDAHNLAIYRCAKGDDREVCGWMQHPCRMPGGRPKARFGASAVVVGAEDVLGRCLKHLGLTIEPFCSSLEPSGQRGTHCRGAVDATGLSVIWLVIPVD